MCVIWSLSCSQVMVKAWTRVYMTWSLLPLCPLFPCSCTCLLSSVWLMRCPLLLKCVSSFCPLCLAALSLLHPTLIPLWPTRSIWPLYPLPQPELSSRAGFSGALSLTTQRDVSLSGTLGRLDCLSLGTFLLLCSSGSTVKWFGSHLYPVAACTLRNSEYYCVLGKISPT